MSTLWKVSRNRPHVFPKLKQVRIYLKWLRYVLFITLDGRPYVVVNMDETCISSAAAPKKGLMVPPAVRNPRGWRRRPGGQDRTNTKTTLLAVACDQPDLQPYLPQVILSRYTAHAIPPAWAQELYDASGMPFEYWHRSNGSVTPAIFIRWATRLRSVVHSFNNTVWILLILDCSSVHLDLRSMLHLQRLGILCVVLPHKCIWLLQLLDVYVFAELKTRLHQSMAAERMRNEDWRPARGSWVGHCARAARDIVVNRDWSDHFDRLGTALDVDQLRPEVRQYVGDDPLDPALPTRAEFARLTHRQPHTEGTATLHRTIMRTIIRTQTRGHDALPPQGAVHALEHVLPAVVRAGPPVPAADWAAVVGNFLDNQEQLGLPPDAHHGRAPAVQLVL